MPITITVQAKTREQRAAFIEQALACADKQFLAGMNATTATEAALCEQRETAYLRLASALILQQKGERHA